MTTNLSRRAFLRLALATAAAVVVAACTERNGPSSSPLPGSPIPTTAVPPPTSPSSTPSDTPAASLRATIAGLLVVGFRGMTGDEAGPIADAIENDGLGGVILFDRDQLTGKPRNIESPAQVRDLVDDLRRRASRRPLLVAIDQEGGRVARLTPATGFPLIVSEAEIGQTGDEDAALAWGRLIAQTLASVGVNLNLAPVVDLNVNPANPAIGALDRAFSADPDVVGRLALAEIAAHHESGVTTSLKHFPGLGSATVNTDFGVADVTRTWTRTELEPYRAIIGAGAADTIMVGNLVNGQFDADRPASLSPAIVNGLLRTDLAWDGVVITDDLQAAAVTSTFGNDEAIALAIEAGNDLLLLANQQSYDPEIASRTIDTIEGLVASGRISREQLDASAGRVARLFEARLSGS